MGGGWILKATAHLKRLAEGLVAALGRPDQLSMAMGVEEARKLPGACPWPRIWTEA